jgi:hypothetical protein
MNNQNNSMTPENLQHFIDTNGIEATILPMNESTPTVMDAARVLDVRADQVIKSLIFIANGNPILVINKQPGWTPVNSLKTWQSAAIVSEWHPRKKRYPSADTWWEACRLSGTKNH